MKSFIKKENKEEKGSFWKLICESKPEQTKWLNLQIKEWKRRDIADFFPSRWCEIWKAYFPVKWTAANEFKAST